jgi:LPXTG-motif cell wall-anchored protein
MALTVACGIAFAAGIGTFQAKADAWDKKTILTVNQTIQVRDTVLEPGQYVLKLYNSNAERHIVQIFNADQSHLINTVMAIPKQRMEPTGDTQFAFWETPAGTARAMRSWFYPGDTIGQEFPYPKHLIALASAAPAPVPTLTQPAQPEAAPQPETTPQPQASTRDRDAEDHPTENQPVEIAENSPPPAPEQAPAPAASEPAPPTPQPAQELPKTGSPYPVLGIAGGVLLGIYGLLRLKRLA